jgi:AraC-like DNA-binding protein
MTRQSLPTTSGFATKRAIMALRKRKVAVAPLLQRAGLSKRDLIDRQHRIPSAAQSKFLEYAAKALDDSAFGLHIAEQANPREAGLLFHVASAGNNVGEALALLERYSRIANEAVRPKLIRVPEGMIVEVDFLNLSRFRQNAEFVTAVLLKALREATGRNIRPAQVTFTFGRDSELREFKRFYGCPVEFGTSSDQLVFTKEMLSVPLVTGDRYLLRTLRPICDEAARERGTAKGTLRCSLEIELQRLLPHGKARRQTIARTFFLSERTLVRRLADEGTTYAEVLDQLRRTLALQYIKQPDLSLSQIAWLLGYEKPTSLNHAFTRWTGRSPSAFRS